ncbi:MAG: PorP/SprF family type IX secretion system membrane protein [Bacteroidia bacterium]|nr:PorP/SprF family type IX secretion system membrane protein [Bacteroidia bacterium]
MEKNLYFLLFVALTVGFPTLGNAQADLVFAQPTLAPLYYNPAFAGSLEEGRISATYQNQLVGIPGTPKSFLFAWDQNFQKLRGGIGVMAFYSSKWGQNRGELAASWAPKLKFGGKWTFSPSLAARVAAHQTYYVTQSTGWQLAPDLQAGFLLNNGSFFAGMAANHLLNPKFIPPPPFSDQVVRFPKTYNLLSGYTFKRGENANWSWSLIELLLLEAQELPLSQLTASVKYRIWIWGVGVQNSLQIRYPRFNAFNFMAAWKGRTMRINYTYSYNTTKLSAFTSGSHEISFIYYLAPTL